jgi:hypothetical protein
MQVGLTLYIIHNNDKSMWQNNYKSFITAVAQQNSTCIRHIRGAYGVTANNYKEWIPTTCTNDFCPQFDTKQHRNLKLKTIYIYIATNKIYCTG